MKSCTLLIIALLMYALAYGQEIPREGLVGYWKIDEGEGAILVDSSGLGANGEIFGRSDWVDGYMGKALEFDGVDGYVDFGPGDGQFDIEEELTLSIWVNQWDMRNGQHNPWLTKGDNAYAIKHQNANQYEFFIFDGDWTSAHAPLDDAHLYSWHHFVGTFDGFDLKLYIDGMPVDTVAHEAMISMSEHSLALAWNSQETSRFFNGQLDEAMIYNVALTDEQIVQLYNVKSAVMQERTLANSFTLRQNYPNPFNPLTTISYTIPATLPVSLKVYDALGTEVATLVAEQQTIGTHSASFDASALSSGIYFYKLQAGEALMETKKMMLLK
ncbi:T9SS type A sorting domain-containing protein [candidate division KSB1 bacterium]|nr:T9SS type A sorting domain-containing protein [candidate division KSB1 bacterium]